MQNNTVRQAMRGWGWTGWVTKTQTFHCDWTAQQCQASTRHAIIELEKVNRFSVLFFLFLSHTRTKMDHDTFLWQFPTGIFPVCLQSLFRNPRVELYVQSQINENRIWHFVFSNNKQFHSWKSVLKSWGEFYKTQFKQIKTVVAIFFHFQQMSLNNFPWKLTNLNKQECACFFDVCSFAIMSISPKGRLNTIQTRIPVPRVHNPPPSGPHLFQSPSPAVVDWLRRLRNAFMLVARGSSHNRAVCVVKD